MIKNDKFKFKDDKLIKLLADDYDNDDEYQRNDNLASRAHYDDDVLLSNNLNEGEQLFLSKKTNDNRENSKLYTYKTTEHFYNNTKIASV